MGFLPQGLLTQHALMSPCGEFAYEIGLIPKILGVPIHQKSIVHMPLAKVLTFLTGILTGSTYLKDLNEGPHPLARDWPATRARVWTRWPTTVASVEHWLPATKSLWGPLSRSCMKQNSLSSPKKSS